jgi:hypothetical protein
MSEHSLHHRSGAHVVVTVDPLRTSWRLPWTVRARPVGVEVLPRGSGLAFGLALAVRPAGLVFGARRSRLRRPPGSPGLCREDTGPKPVWSTCGPGSSGPGRPLRAEAKHGVRLRFRVVRTKQCLPKDRYRPDTCAAATSGQGGGW